MIKTQMIKKLRSRNDKADNKFIIHCFCVVIVAVFSFVTMMKMIKNNNHFDSKIISFRSKKIHYQNLLSKANTNLLALNIIETKHNKNETKNRLLVILLKSQMKENKRSFDTSNISSEEEDNEDNRENLIASSDPN